MFYLCLLVMSACSHTATSYNPFQAGPAKDTTSTSKLDARSGDGVGKVTNTDCSQVGTSQDL